MQQCAYSNNLLNVECFKQTTFHVELFKLGTRMSQGQIYIALLIGIFASLQEEFVKETVGFRLICFDDHHTGYHVHDNYMVKILVSNQLELSK